MQKLEPPLDDEARDIRGEAGGWTEFSHSYGLEPTDPADNDEAQAIIEAMAESDRSSNNADLAQEENYEDDNQVAQEVPYDNEDEAVEDVAADAGYDEEGDFAQGEDDYGDDDGGYDDNDDGNDEDW